MYEAKKVINKAKLYTLISVEMYKNKGFEIKNKEANIFCFQEKSKSLVKRKNTIIASIEKNTENNLNTKILLPSRLHQKYSK